MRKTKGRSENGITLIALVITIIVLIILAGISISMISGNDGILARAGQAKDATSLAKVQELLDLAFIESLDKYGEYNETAFLQKAKDAGYELVADATGATGIKIEPETVTLAPGASTNVQITYEGGTGSSYYVEIDGKKHKATLTGNGVEISKDVIEESGTASNIEVSSSNDDAVEVTVSGNTITLKAKEGAATQNVTVNVTNGGTTKNITVAVQVMPTEGESAVASTVFDTSYGTIDIVWLDTDNNIISEPLSPANYLSYQGKSMTPVVYDSTKTENDANGEFVETTDKSKGNWYNYNGVEDQNKWANAKTANGSYFVWIPRYAYRITYYAGSTTNADGTVTPTGNPTGYYDGYGQWDATTGNKRVALDEGIETVEYGGTKYIVHPAFCDNTANGYDNGGWSEDIAGFWCAKYEARGTSTAIKFVPGVSSSISMTIGNQYKAAITATYGYSDLTANDDGVTSYMNSHQMKNSEWGAVAYLAHSKYGLNGKEIAINNSNPTNASGITTGMSGGSANAGYSSSSATYAYNTENGVKASTTQNVYGIYDLSGGADEYVAIFNSKDSDGNFSRYGWNQIGTIPGINGTVDSETKLTSAVSTKYATKYNNETTSYYGNSIIYTVGKVGDGTKEVNIGGKISTTDTSNIKRNWNDDSPYFVCADDPFCRRGGYFSNGFSAGLFFSNCSYGVSSSGNSFRAVLVSGAL